MHIITALLYSTVIRARLYSSLIQNADNHILIDDSILNQPLKLMQTLINQNLLSHWLVRLHCILLSFIIENHPML